MHGQCWANQWVVNFNPDKAKSMVFTNKHVAHPPFYFNYKAVDELHLHNHLGYFVIVE